MGEQFSKSAFSAQEEEEFFQRIRNETKLLKRFLETRSFPYHDKLLLGLEVEACLLDQNFSPNPINKKFLEEIKSDLVVEELSKYNFELNVEPITSQHGALYDIQKSLDETWSHCKKVSERLDSHNLLCGIQPTISQEHLEPEFMSEGGRYQALNDRILEFRQGKDIDIDIRGEDHLKFKIKHVLIEAAATSVQVHIQGNQEDIVRKYNASQIISAPAVAVAANSPYLFGNKLWEETRIPLFEQSVYTPCFRNKKGVDVGRVFFGNSYAKRSILEVFIENLDGFPPLIPILFDDKEEDLHHLRFHSGTIWRWNRPILGISDKGPHLRIEQRVMASGPSMIDIVANTAFSIGLTQYFSSCEKDPTESMTYTDCKNNFYTAAKYGLKAKLRWFGKEIHIKDLIIDDLLPKAAEALLQFGYSKDEVDFYLNDVIFSRVNSGQNGSYWQQAFIEKYGSDFHNMTELYLQNQESGIPVARWRI